jgi:hypothetical protein
MIENLCIVASVLILLLGVSMLIPTRKRYVAPPSYHSDKSGLSTELSQLVLGFAIESWKSRNTLRSQSVNFPPTQANTIWQMLWNHSDEVVPLSWIEPKTKLLTRQSLYSLCTSAQEAAPTAWCIFAICGALAGEHDASLTPLQQELGLREIAQQWSGVLGNYGLIAADENDCLWLAVPYEPAVDPSANIALARMLYSRLQNSQMFVNDVGRSCNCKLRFAEIDDAAGCEQTLKLLMESREQESPIQFYDGRQWQIIDPQETQKTASAPQDTIENVKEASPAELAQFLAEIKTKPAAMCIKDDIDEQSNAVGSDDETGDVVAASSDVQNDQELVAAETEIRQDLNEIRQDVHAATASESEETSKVDVSTSEKVTADDIAKLFAAARGDA